MCLNFIKKTRFGLVTPVTIELFKGKKKKEKKTSTRQWREAALDNFWDCFDYNCLFL